jgi:hypothetical protein
LDSEARLDIKANYLEANDEAISYIVSQINKRCYNEVIDKITVDSAVALWTKISNQYASKSVVNRGRVFMKWSELTYSGDLQKFINEMRAALLDIELVSIDIPPTIISYVILGKLMKAPELDQLVDKITMTEESVETPYLVLDALQTFKTHHMNKILSETSSASALVNSAPSTVFASKTLHYCGNKQHNPQSTTHTEDRCFHKYPHLKEDFLKRRNKGPSDASASFAHATVLMVSTANTDNNMFVLDSAATHHMIRNRTMFSSFTSQLVNVKTGNPNTPLIARGFDTASIISNNNVIELKNSLYVPEISQQLISLTQLLDQSLTITKKGSNFLVTNPLTKLFSGFIKDNLLFISAMRSAVYMTGIQNVGSSLWHHCLGHPSNQILRELRLPRPHSNECNVCQCSKMTLLPFSSHFSTALFPLHRIHLDLVGPVNPSSVSGFQYFLTCVDQFSSFKFVRFLKSKSDTLNEFKKLVALMENAQNSTVKEIVSDRGGEFVNHAFKEFTAKRGINHILSPPYTPEHNGFAKRANHTIIEKARCILMTSKLPRAYWAEAVNTAVFVSNFLPTSSRQHISPWELWTKTSPPLSRLKLFGC